MNQTGPIVIIEDDEDDQEAFRDAFEQLNPENEIIYFTDGEAALEYLTTTHQRPFLILSDINLPKLDGFELRDKIHNNELLKVKCIPYLFFTTVADQRNVINAYSKSIQGFFTKPATQKDLTRVLNNILEYWKDCHSPNIVV